jgi:hypothetical protein
MAQALAYVVENWALAAPDDAAQTAKSAVNRLLNALAAIGLSGNQELRLAATDLATPIGELMQAATRRGPGWDVASNSFDKVLSQFQSTAARILDQ